jgi:serine/threonine-protein kinase HipA
MARDHREVVGMYRRMMFNILGSNKDDYTRNFTLTMDKKGAWKVSPVYDTGYSSGDNGLHYMTINGRRRNIELADFKQLAEDFGIREWKHIIEEACESLGSWKKLASRCDVPVKLANAINQRISENIRRLHYLDRFVL